MSKLVKHQVDPKLVIQCVDELFNILDKYGKPIAVAAIYFIYQSFEKSGHRMMTRLRGKEGT